MTRKTLCIIPARGGSKGIPRKNVRHLAGKPLLAYSIEAARHTPSINRIMVSTDDPEIAEVARRYGAEVIWRPAEISGDTATSESALLHALELLQRTEGYEPDLLVFMQCTSPLTLALDIQGTIDALLTDKADSALAVTPFHYFLWRQDKDGVVGINHDKSFRPRRQDREQQFLETGAVYVMRSAGFREARHRFFGKTAMYVMPAERVLEIDEPVDFLLAEVLIRERQHSEQLRLLPEKIAALVLDFDGVFTDNKVIVFQDGTEGVVCHRGDGWGLSQLIGKGLPIVVISTEENPVVQARCRKLGLECIQGQKDKGAVLKRWLDDRGIDAMNAIYIGNDLNDLSCMKMAGCPVAVADAHPEIKTIARVVLNQKGGQGAIRELAELILSKMEDDHSD